MSELRLFSGLVRSNQKFAQTQDQLQFKLDFIRFQGALESVDPRLGSGVDLRVLLGKVGPKTNRWNCFNELANTKFADYHFNLVRSGFSAIDPGHVSNESRLGLETLGDLPPACIPSVTDMHIV